MAVSLLLPVVSTSAPSLFDSVMRIVPRIRACRFSSASPGGPVASGSVSISRKAAWAGSMGTVRVRMPRLAASASASWTLPRLEKRDGMRMPTTWSAPRASAAMVATSDESIPPERPMSTSVNVFLRT